MSDYLDANGIFINSIVGEGTRFSGDMTLNGLLRIDGDFFGTINTTGKVLIGKNGRAECDIRAETVVVGGVIKGDIISSGKVVILSTGMLLGNISAPRLIVEEGVVLNGSCEIMQLEEKNRQDLPGISMGTNGGEKNGRMEKRDHSSDLERFKPDRKKD